jgi:hypothetical protein
MISAFLQWEGMMCVHSKRKEGMMRAFLRVRGDHVHSYSGRG